MPEILMLFCGMILGLIPAAIMIVGKMLKNGVVINVSVAQPQSSYVTPQDVAIMQAEMDKAAEENIKLQKSMDAYLRGLNQVMTGGDLDG